MKTSADFSMTKYEDQQTKEIANWKADEPWEVSKALGLIVEPAAWLVQKIVPGKAMRGAIEAASSGGKWLADEKDIMRDGGVSSIEDLQEKDLELSDNLANTVHNWAIGAAVVEGTATGWNPLGLIPDIPALITLAFRTIHKIGLCYGYRAKTEDPLCQ